MTSEEAVTLLEATKKMTEGISDLHKACEMAISALEKSEKYKWHDLRKNPEDLPEMYYVPKYDWSDSAYLEFMYHEEEFPIIGFLRKHNNLVFGCEENWRTDDVEKYNVIAWRYFEPLEVEK